MGIGGRPGYHRATVVGGGVIGISWTALSLANGLDVTVCATLARLGLSVDELTDQPRL
jgi:3-hydroxyacyl-CoA dehydrogenase